MTTKIREGGESRPFRNRKQGDILKMGITDPELHEELRQYLKSHSAFLPDAILAELRPELDFDLLYEAREAIRHLRAHVRIDMDDEGNYVAEGIADSAYGMQQARVNYVLLRDFAKSKKTLLNSEVFWGAEKNAADALLEEFVYYDRDNGEGASDCLPLYRSWWLKYGGLIPSLSLDTE